MRYKTMALKNHKYKYWKTQRKEERDKKEGGNSFVYRTESYGESVIDGARKRGAKWQVVLMEQ